MSYRVQTKGQLVNMQLQQVYIVRKNAGKLELLTATTKNTCICNNAYRSKVFVILCHWIVKLKLLL